jgi:hypothetical protein
VLDGSVESGGSDEGSGAQALPTLTMRNDAASERMHIDHVGCEAQRLGSESAA